MDMPKINAPAPDFTGKAYVNDGIEAIRLSDFKGKWVVLFFYPGDFTFICPTELGELAEKHDKFKALGAEIIGVSTDSEFVHKAWHDATDTIKQIKYPMLSDKTGKISKDYGVYIEEEGVALRGTFLIDPDGILKACEIHDNSIGRSSAELIRKLQAAKFVREHKGQVCPMNWSPGAKTLKPGLDLVGKI
jgi:NADH-dependent peroxiredoxin subunit C